MPSAFSATEAKTLGRVFASFGVSASYLSPDFVTSACVVVLNQADDSVTLGNVPLVAGQTIVEVRVSELAAPVKGGVFTVDGRDYRIVAAPKRNDPSGLVWTCLCDLQPA
ncbi:MAG: hypothetical protein FJX45_12225 [Alphaproteobacteria bacterium]|nr:hypothetical protein [Alphaproteobacteria bacterium]MBM3654743.1 hypothetical protein [Alphaproteobacteria bacterium]